MQHAKQSTELSVETTFESCGARTNKRRNKAIHRAWETQARSDSYKKHKSVSGEMYTFLEVKLRRLRRKT